MGQVVSAKIQELDDEFNKFNNGEHAVDCDAERDSTTPAFICFWQFHRGWVSCLCCSSGAEICVQVPVIECVVPTVWCFKRLACSVVALLNGKPAVPPFPDKR